MKALQLHYTSCRRGQSGSPGFQTRALSSGIRSDEQREIERRGVYRPPRGLPAEPTAKEVAREFPRAFRFYRLESGRRALTFSCYIGKDYSGRWGNFFAHTLVLDEEMSNRAPWSRPWPIDYYEWEGWCHGLEQVQEEEEGSSPKEHPNASTLPLAELQDTPRAESFCLAELQGFVSEEPDRRELLAQMGRAVILGQETSRPLVVRADGLDGPFWVACILKLFPPRHAWDLSCSTYQDDPRGAAAINATVAGAGFAFSEAERLYQFYLFDPAEGIASEVPENDDDYPALASRWLAEEPETLEAFFSFLHRFEPFPLDGGELSAAAGLFCAGRGEVAKLEGRRLAELLAFAGHRATRNGRVALLEELGEILLRSVDSGALAGDGRVLRFLAEVAVETGEPPHRQIAVRFWLRWLEQRLSVGGAGLEALGRSWVDLRRILRAFARDLAAGFLEREQAERFAPHLSKLSVEPLGWLLCHTWECLEILGRAPVWGQEEVRALVQRLMAAGRREGREDLAVEWILRPGRGKAEALVGLCREMLSAAPGLPEELRRQIEARVGRGLGKALYAEPVPVAAKVRRFLEGSERWNVLYGEWLYRLAESHDPTETFTIYDREVLDALQLYRQQARSRVAESLLSALGGERSAAQAAHWVASGETDSFPPDLRKTCVTLANRRISLDAEDPASERLAARVEDKAGYLRLRLQPNYPLLLRLLCEVYDAGVPLTGWRGQDLQAAMEGIEAEPYRRFLNGYLLPSLESVRNYKEHEGRLLAVYREPLRDVFTEIYSGFFTMNRSAGELAPLQAGVKLWLLLDPAEKESSPLVSLQEGILEAMARGLRRLPRKSFRVLQQRLGRAKLADRALRRWRRIEELVCARQTGLLKSVFSSLKELRGSRSSRRPSN